MIQRSELVQRFTANAPRQIVRYAVAGALAFSVDFAALTVLTEVFRVYYLTSAALAFPLGVGTSYVLSVAWVFDRRAYANRWIEIGIFVSIAAVGLGLNEAGIWAFTELAGQHYLVSKVIATGLVFLWNFFAKKVILFS